MRTRTPRAASITWSERTCSRRRVAARDCQPARAVRGCRQRRRCSSRRNCPRLASQLTRRLAARASASMRIGAWSALTLRMPLSSTAPCESEIVAVCAQISCVIARRSICVDCCTGSSPSRARFKLRFVDSVTTVIQILHAPKSCAHSPCNVELARHRHARE